MTIHFGSRPYEQVRLRDIAADSDVTAQTLHARFGSKDELLAAAYAWWGEQEAARRDAAPVGDVTQAASRVFDHYEAHGQAILRMLSQEDRLPAVRELTDYGRAWHRQWVERTFEPQINRCRGAARKRRLNAIVIATDVLVWKLLRLDMKLTRDQAEQTVVEMIHGPNGTKDNKTRV